MAQVAEATYSTGRFARLFKTSSYHVRKLLEAELLDGELTDAQRWQIPVSRAARFEKSGLPPIPQTSSENASPRPKFANGRPALLGAPSEDLIASAEDVLATENLLKKRKLEWELLTTDDLFTARESEQEAQEAEQTYLEQSRVARDQASQERNESVRSWEAHALGLVPRDAPPELRPDVQCAIRDRLLALNPMPTKEVAQQLTEALVARLTAPWLREQDIIAILVEARDEMLPAGARGSGGQISPWQSRVIWAAAAGIRKLRDDASSEEIRFAAKQAVAQVAAEFAHERACQEMARWIFLPGTSEEDEQARAAVKEAMGKLPVGASQTQMEDAKAAAIPPVRDAIAARQAEQAQQAAARLAEQAAERRQHEDQRARNDVADAYWKLPWGLSGEVREKALAEIRKAIDALPAGTPGAELEQARDRIIERYRQAHERQEKVARLIDGGLRQIGPYIVVLEKKWRFIGKSAAALEAELGQPVRTALESQLSGGETPEEVGRRVRQLVRRELDIAPSRAA
jgi:hypothetical protein